MPVTKLTSDDLRDGARENTQFQKLNELADAVNDVTTGLAALQPEEPTAIEGEVAAGPLKDLLTALDALGLVVDATTAPE